MYDPRQWNFVVADMNYSGSVTISDVWLWFKWLYFYPGDGVIYALINNVPCFGKFFEITYNSYGGILSGIISFFVWGFIYLIVIGYKEDIEDFWNEKIRKRKIDDKGQDM